MRRFAARNSSISLQISLALCLVAAAFGCAGSDDDDDSGASDDDAAVDDDAAADDDLADDDADDDWIPPTTLDLTLVPEPDDSAPLGYSLVEGPGEPRETRNDLGVAPTRAMGNATPLSMAYYLSMADFQITDEESPTRLTFFDSNQIVGGAFSAAYRPHEDVSPHLVNSLIRTANAIQSGYGRDFDFAIVLGDLTDNSQHNEMALVIDVFDANGISTGVPGWARPDSGDLDIDPDTGRNRGERNFGIQEEDGEGNSINAFDRPGLPNSNADFPTVGLRRADGSGVPWLAVLGNHDVLNTGNFDPDSGLTFYSREDYLSGLSRYGYISGVAAVIQFMQDNPGQSVFIDGGIFGLDLDWRTVLDLLNLLGLVPDDLSADLDTRFDIAGSVPVVRDDLTWKMAPWNTLAVGVEGMAGDFHVTADVIRPPKEGDPSANLFNERAYRYDETLSIAIFEGYLEDSVKIADTVVLTPGVRATAGTFYNEDIEVTKSSFDPRFFTRVFATKKLTFKGAVGVYHQYPQPDEFLPPFGTDQVDPEYAVSYNGGAEYDFGEGWSLDAQGYYKQLENLVAGTNADDPEPYNNEGIGHVYGAELLARKDLTDRLYGWLSYTFTVSERRDQPGDDWRYFDQDQRHNVVVVASYRLGDHWRVGGRFTYATGLPFTEIESALYNADTDSYVPLYSDKINGQRDDDIHQLDVRVDRAWEYTNWQLTVYLDLQNVYFRKQPVGYIYNYDYTQREALTLPTFYPTLGVAARW